MKTEELKELIEEYHRALTASAHQQMIQDADDTRFCRWDGQSPDGRKWDINQPEGKMVKPWDGASDTRVPLADEIINENVSVLVTAMNRALVRVQGVESKDVEGASALTTYANWLISTKLAEELQREVELSAQFGQAYGWCLIYTGWERELTVRRVSLSLDEVEAGAQSMVAEGVSVKGMILDELSEDAAVELMIQIYEAQVRARVAGIYDQELKPLAQAVARKYVRALREKGEVEISIPVVAKDQPCVVALKPWEDVVMPPETAELQRARAIYWRRWMTEGEIRQAVAADGWDSKWADRVIEKKGSVSPWLSGAPMGMDRSGNSIAVNFQYSIPGTHPLIEVVHAYSKVVDDEGVTSVVCSVFCPQLGSEQDEGGVIAKSEALGYAHGRYPFVAYQRERLGRAQIQSRGVPEIVRTTQMEEKEQRDMLLNRAHWDTLPPIMVPKLQGIQPRIGPGAQIPEVRAGSFRFMDSPNRAPSLALELIGLIGRRVDNYFGRLSEDVPAQRSQVKTELMVRQFFQSWSKVLQMVLTLEGQYGSKERFERVTGKPWTSSAEAVMEQYDFVLRFDSRELNTDFLLEKMDIVSKSILPEDVAGVIDRAKLVKLKLRAIDPTLADEIIMDTGSASQQLFRQVNQDMALMALGNEPEYVENDPTAETKLQYARDIVQRNPKYQQLLGHDRRFGELVGKYEKNLNQSIMQEQNKMRGKIGV